VWNSVIAVPAGDHVRVTPASGALDGLTATWDAIEGGFAIRFRLPWDVTSQPLRLDVVVNERPFGRERRRGQLVLSGAHGESAYLRGARQAASRALRIVFEPVTP
jgi:hypothetical protein